MIYEPHSRNKGMTPAQQRFVEAQQARQERMAAIDQQVKRTNRRVSLARRVSVLLAVCSFCVIGGGAFAVFNQFGSTPNQPTAQAAIAVNTPQPTTTLQQATWDTSQVTSQDDDLGYVVVPEGFWQQPGAVEAYRAGTPIAVLVEQQVGKSNITQPITQAVSTPDPAIEQARNELAVAQIQADIDIAMAEAEAAQQIEAAKAQQAIERSQAVSNRRAELVQLGYSIVFWLLMFAAGAVLLRLVVAPLTGWLIDGLVDFIFARIDNMRAWLQPDDGNREDEQELPEHIRSLQINHSGSRRHQELERQANSLPCTPDEIKIILDTWDETKNLTECQRRAFGKDEKGKYRTGGAFYDRAKPVIDLYRPGHDTPTPPARIEPFLGDTTQ